MQVPFIPLISDTDFVQISDIVDGEHECIYSSGRGCHGKCKLGAF